MPGRTASELMFEMYLAGRGIQARYEELPDGATRPVDYSFEVDGVTVRCEVKEWAARSPEPRIGCLDPYEPIRDKIRKARRQFTEYKGRGEPCLLVLCNPTAALIPLDDVSVIGAMLGDIGHSMPFDSSTGAADAGLASLTSVASGSMHRETARGEDRVQNTTISAVAALGEFDQRLRRAEIDIRKTEGECQGPLTLAEKARVVSDVHRDAPGGAEIRLVVYDNISAVVPLPPSFPSGPLDERIGHFGKRLRRTYVGAALATLEGKERAGGITRDDPLGLRNVTACDG